MQENRKQFSGIRNMHGYLRCMSGALNGDHGCEVSFSATIHFAIDANGEKVRIERESLTIVYADPRCIIVRVCVKCIDCYFVSAHAPYKQSTTPFAPWWTKFSNQVKRFCVSGLPIVIGIDGNSQIYKHDAFDVGDVGVTGGAPPPNYTCMTKSFLELGVALPGLHRDCCVHSDLSEYGTFVPTKSDTPITLDYIGLANGVVCVANTHCRRPGLARGKIDKDHIPIGADVIIPIKISSSSSKRRIVDYDHGKLNEPECRNAFAACIRDFPCVGVEVENTSHCHLLDSYVHDALVKCFPKDRCVKKKDHISTMAFELIVKGHGIRNKNVQVSMQVYQTMFVCAFWRVERA